MIDIFGIISIDASYVVIALLATIVFSIITFILAIVGIVKASKMKKKYNQFMAGSDGTSIEKLIKTNLRDVKEIKDTTIKNSQNIEDIYNKLETTFCKIGINKYDAFHEMGGKLSFALCMLDKKNNGYIVNVMHSNNGCFAYIKEIVNGESYIELGGEEKKALDDALAGRDGDAEIGQRVNNMIDNSETPDNSKVMSDNSDVITDNTDDDVPANADDMLDAEK